MKKKPTAIIIGAGPAGLTAAYELLTRTEIQPIVLEMSDAMGGLSRTVNYKGNRIDIGGHRFFSKSDRVMEWWLNFLPLQQLGEARAEVTYQHQHRSVAPSSVAPDPDHEDRVMLLRNRLSRIYFMRRFFNYPIALSIDTIRKLGPLRTALIGLSYARSVLFPIRPEKTLEDFFINRFGRRLYSTFFQSYTEKVWGLPCNQISAEWGAQRVKGLSVYKTLVHFLKNTFAARQSDIAQKGTETSLIERFLYPKFGPGQMWEEVARCITAQGCQILTGWRVDRIEHQDHRRITAIWAVHPGSGERRRFEGDYFFSTMPVRDLAAALEPDAPAEVREISDGLVYRDFMVVGLLSKRLTIGEKLDQGRIKDNWIYVQEPDVLVGRLQIFNNWSPYMVADSGNVWIGLEYFCNETDDLWKKPDPELAQLAKDELAKLRLADPEDILDSTVIRVPKAYPAYFGSYERFGEISRYTDGFENLFLVGRNGMHRYNNQDHSMLAAMTAVDNIVSGVRSRANLWALNTEQEYHEEKQ
ncbi:MAG TPA: NAD(P)/FAD-dependent oxidoreductase [Terriglobia bacterium]|nr:NAD(P)/FAD-dependent oxidoreductase [Terriglobia bacterium]